MKLLIIEDEESIQFALRKGFTKLGYTIDTASDGEEALDLYFSNTYSLILLDLNLPKLDGLEVLKEIRYDNKNLPVLILSARSEVEDKISGLDLGANDYVAKPFNFKELDARIRALLRRDFSTKDTTYECDDIRVDTSLKKVYLIKKHLLRNSPKPRLNVSHSHPNLTSGFNSLNELSSENSSPNDVASVNKSLKDSLSEEIPLSKKEYAILEYLILHRGQVISPSRLIDHIWDSDSEDAFNTLKVHLSTMRKKLPADFIKNKRGVGYYVE